MKAKIAFYIAIVLALVLSMAIASEDNLASEKMLSEKMEPPEAQTVFGQEKLIRIMPHEQITIRNDGYAQDLHAYEIAIESDTVVRKSSPDKLPLDVQAVLLFTEDFEESFPGDWSVGDDNSQNGQDYWDDLSCGYQNGNRSAWCADIGDMPDCNYYDDNMDAYMTSVCVTVGGYNYVYLSYWLWYNTEPGYDFIRRYYSSDGQNWTLSNDNYSGTSTSSCNGGWIRKVYRLNNFNTYCMRFRFYSDGSIHNYGGAYVDNIVILGSTQPRPDPTIVNYWQSEDEINLGQTFEISLYVNNDGGLSDDGAAILSFPSFTQEGDRNHVSLISGGGDTPGYQEYEHGDLIWLWSERQVPADYLTVQYEDNNWVQGEQNSFVVEVEPQEQGVFSIYVRANLGLWPIYFNEPFSANNCDQQGWPVDRYSVYVGPPTAVDESPPGNIPTNYELFSNHPNPFNASTLIRYSLPSASKVTIEIFDILGHRVETLVQAEQPAGHHQVVWDASNISSGMYFYRIQAGEFVETKKMILLK